MTAILVEDISRAIKSSDLLSLLLPMRQPGPKCLSEIPKSILDERVKPIRSVLENIDAEKLLDLEIFRKHSRTMGPRLRDGVYCKPICDQIRPELQVDTDVSMGGDNHSKNNKSSIVRYIHIAEVPDEYTIGIFVFGPHQRIPLHDHPEMCVLSRVLYGDLQRLSLDLDRKGRTPSDVCFDGNDMDVDDDVEEENHLEEDPNDGSSSSIRNFLEKQSTNQTESNNNNSSSSFFAALSRSANWLHHSLYNGSSSSGFMIENDTDTQQHYPEGTQLAYRNTIDVLEAPNVASLYPYDGNLHEFVAGPYGAAVLDVLLPPYDDGHRRDCTFYNIREIPLSTSKTTTTTSTARRGRHTGSNGVSSKEKTPATNNKNTVTASMFTTISSQQCREPCLIVPTGQPENFHCISGRYKELGDSDDYGSDDDQ